MKIMTILGTSPEIIRLSLIIKKLDQFSQKHLLVHTRQNYTTSLSDVFFDQLRIRKPDYTFMSGFHTIGKQLGQMFSEVESIVNLQIISA
ncbi:hypothetical protein LSG31_20475 [Fodinisporobacter ferrooxydans]|uniref:UDP-N-acetylglucosamine 2-epimerase domain-containing protein n=1 Tax=Fodinisporobacter ferrooxydans TaxID=2901836 RepID=A0ABY4CIT7_9BACL|nr:hypothetical protein LSG31_20475 [Alicyclobacillaceae bacterium MYW30-H2]